MLVRVFPHHVDQGHRHGERFFCRDVTFYSRDFPMTSSEVAIHEPKLFSVCSSNSGSAYLSCPSTARFPLAQFFNTAWMRKIETLESTVRAWKWWSFGSDKPSTSSRSATSWSSDHPPPRIPSSFSAQVGLEQVWVQMFRLTQSVGVGKEKRKLR